MTDEPKVQPQNDQSADASHEPDVVLDLDTLERENAPLPFTFRHGGRRYMLRDPQDVDWQELLLAIDNSYQFFHSVLPADDQKEFFKAPMPSWKMKALMERSDGPAIRDTIIWLVAFVSFGVGGHVFWGTWLAVPSTTSAAPPLARAPKTIRKRGYRLIAIRHDRPFDEQIAQRCGHGHLESRQ